MREQTLYPVVFKPGTDEIGFLHFLGLPTSFARYAYLDADRMAYLRPDRLMVWRTLQRLLGEK